MQITRTLLVWPVLVVLVGVASISASRALYDSDHDVIAVAVRGSLFAAIFLQTTKAARSPGMTVCLALLAGAFMCTALSLLHQRGLFKEIWDYIWIVEITGFLACGTCALFLGFGSKANVDSRASTVLVIVIPVLFAVVSILKVPFPRGDLAVESFVATLRMNDLLLIYYWSFVWGFSLLWEGWSRARAALGPSARGGKP